MGAIEEQVDMTIAALEDGLWRCGNHDLDGYQVRCRYIDGGVFEIYRHYQDGKPDLTPIALEALVERFRQYQSDSASCSAHREMLLLVEQARAHLVVFQGER